MNLTKILNHNRHNRAQRKVKKASVLNSKAQKIHTYRYSRNWKINTIVENCISTMAYCAYCGLNYIMVK